MTKGFICFSDLDKSETFQTVIERQLVADLQNLPLIKAGDDKV